MFSFFENIEDSTYMSEEYGQFSEEDKGVVRRMQ